MTYHPLDVHPIPRETSPLYVNEPWLIDLSILEQAQLITNLRREPDQKDDNIRIYVPLDLNKDAILRRLNSIIYRYGEANEENEMDFSQDFRMLISQIEIYDQIWYGRHMPDEGEHSAEAQGLVQEFIEKLEEIPDGCAEAFPFEMIDELREEYLGE